MDSNEPVEHFYAEGCVPDCVLVLRDAKGGNTVCRLRAVKAILAAWSPVLRGALECCSSTAPHLEPLGSGALNNAADCSGGGSGMMARCGSSGQLFGAAAGGGVSPASMAPSSSSAAAAAAASSSSAATALAPGLVELPLLVDSHKEAEAWRVAMCLMHPLDPTCGRTPSSFITTCALRPLVSLADKYNLQGLLPHCKDVLLDPRQSFGVPGIHDAYKLDALEWVQVAEGVPGFDAVVTRCITQIVASATSARGRSQRSSGAPDTPRYRGHEALVSAMAGLRPETCAKVASAMACCLAVACENMANQDRYVLRAGGTPWVWEYVYEALRK